jgi:hypothetical protein
VAVLSIAAVVSTMGGPIWRVRAASPAIDPQIGTCSPTLLYQDYDRLFELDPDSGASTPHPWPNQTQIDLKLSDYAPDGTLYAIAKAQPSTTNVSWVAVDLEREVVTDVSPLPPLANGFVPAGFALTPKLDASPRGYLLALHKTNSQRPKLYAIDSVWPMRVHDEGITFPVAYNFTLGLGVSDDGENVYWSTTDMVYRLPAGADHFLRETDLGMFQISSDAVVASPAAGSSVIPIVDGSMLYRVDPQTRTVKAGAINGANFATSLTYRDCPVGGIRVAPDEVLTTTEGGGTAQFTAVLTTPPTADVTVAFRSSNRAEGKVRGRPLVFTPADWFVPRTVRVEGVPDGVPDGAQDYAVTGVVRSEDLAYNARAIAAVNLQNLDEDSVPSAPTVRPSRRGR